MLNQNRLTELIYCILPFTWCNYKDEFCVGMVVSWVLRLCVDSLWKTDLHWHTLNISVSQQKQEESKCQLPARQAVRLSSLTSKTSPCMGKKNANVRHWRDCPFTANASKRGYGIWKSLEKKTVYVCVGHLKCLRISLVVHHNSEQCDRKHIHNLKSPSEEHLSLIFIFQCVSLSRIMHVGWNIIGEIMGVQI